MMKDAMRHTLNPLTNSYGFVGLNSGGALLIVLASPLSSSSLLSTADDLLIVVLSEIVFATGAFLCGSPRFFHHNSTRW